MALAAYASSIPSATFPATCNASMHYPKGRAFIYKRGTRAIPLICVWKRRLRITHNPEHWVGHPLPLALAHRPGLCLLLRCSTKGQHAIQEPTSPTTIWCDRDISTYHLVLQQSRQGTRWIDGKMPRGNGRCGPPFLLASMCRGIRCTACA